MTGSRWAPQDPSTPPAPDQSAAPETQTPPTRGLLTPGHMDAPGGSARAICSNQAGCGQREEPRWVPANPSPARTEGRLTGNTPR